MTVPSASSPTGANDPVGTLLSQTTAGGAPSAPGSWERRRELALSESGLPAPVIAAVRSWMQLQTTIRRAGADAWLDPHDISRRRQDIWRNAKVTPLYWGNVRLAAEYMSRPADKKAIAVALDRIIAGLNVPTPPKEQLAFYIQELKNWPLGAVLELPLATLSQHRYPRFPLYGDLLEYASGAIDHYREWEGELQRLYAWLNHRKLIDTTS